MQKFQYVALGATNEIGASCHFLHLDGTGIILDAGSDPEREGIEGVPHFDIIHKSDEWYVDHALITHAHHDHIGNLPVLMQHFPHAMAHMTPATLKLAEFLLPASARLQRRKIEEGADFDPLFREDEVELLSHLFLTHELREPFNLTGINGATPIHAEFFDAGHILGSAGALISAGEGEDTLRIFYTSDTNTEDQTIIPGGTYPDPPVDVLLLESTSGAEPEREKTTRGLEEEKLRDGLATVLGRGGTALIPVFAMGRSQEVLALLDRYKQEGAIDADVPVYTAGSMRAIADLYDRTRTTTPRLDQTFSVFGVDQKRLPRSRDATSRALQGPSIHVVSSGMMFEPTLSNRLARRLVGDPKNGVFLVGYSKEETPGHALLAASEAGDDVVELSKESGLQPLRCTVDRVRLSGHSNRQQLLELAGRLEPSTILLIHGDEEAQDWMEQALRAKLPDAVIQRPTLGNPVSLAAADTEHA